MASDAEHREQCAVIQWADYARFAGEPIGADLFAIPNGGARHPAFAGKLKAEGVRAGMPDLMLAIPIAPYAGLFVELKAHGGKLTPKQRERLERLNARGYRAVCCEGFDAARIEIEHYLALAGRIYLNGGN